LVEAAMPSGVDQRGWAAERPGRVRSRLHREIDLPRALRRSVGTMLIASGEPLTFACLVASM
jgi:hypothetical protein